jgi:DNA-binding NarL/FixJ family response regulator
MQSTPVSVRVFLADDSAAIRQRVAGMLAASAMTVVGEGETPQGCIAGILDTHPDVVVLDHQLAGGTGLDVIKGVRNADPGVVFVVLSNNAGPAYRKRYLAEGASAFLDKTTEFDRLAQAVTSAWRH